MWIHLEGQQAAALCVQDTYFGGLVVALKENPELKEVGAIAFLQGKCETVAYQ